MNDRGYMVAYMPADMLVHMHRPFSMGYRDTVEAAVAFARGMPSDSYARLIHLHYGPGSASSPHARTA